MRALWGLGMDQDNFKAPLTARSAYEASLAAESLDSGR